MDGEYTISNGIYEKIDAMMNKTQLITNITAATGIPKHTVEDVLSALAGEVKLALYTGKTVVLPRIGSFSLPETPSRRQGGAAYERVPQFTPARPLKENVNIKL